MLDRVEHASRTPATAPSLVVLDRQKENERLTTEIEDLKRIHELSLRVAVARSLSEVLVDVLRTAGGLVGAPLGSVQRLSADGALDMVGQIGFGESITREFPTVRIEDCTTCSVALQRKRRVAVRNLHTDEKFSSIAAALRSYGAVAAISTPVLDHDGNVLAMFSLYWPKEREASERELRVLDLCGELAGRQAERSAAEARQRLLMRELAHRGKNLIAVVQSIAAWTLTNERSMPDARDTFIGRLSALAATYDGLTDEAAVSAKLHDILAVELKPISERASLRGPHVVLPAKNAQTLALVVHELATNALKHGALSVPSGRIEVTWQVNRVSIDDERFVLRWLERGGPPVEAPSRKGFGSVIVTSLVGEELKCEPVLEYSSLGFEYRLECSLSDLQKALG